MTITITTRHYTPWKLPQDCLHGIVIAAAIDMISIPRLGHAIGATSANFGQRTEPHHHRSSTCPCPVIGPWMYLVGRRFRKTALPLYTYIAIV